MKISIEEDKKEFNDSNKDSFAGADFALISYCCKKINRFGANQKDNHT